MRATLYAGLRQVAGCREVTLPLPEGASVRELLAALVRRFPDLRAKLVDEHGALHAHVHLFINGRDAPYLADGLDTRLRADDRVDVFPAVGGG